MTVRREDAINSGGSSSSFGDEPEPAAEQQAQPESCHHEKKPLCERVKRGIHCAIECVGGPNYAWAGFSGLVGGLVSLSAMLLGFLGKETEAELRESFGWKDLSILPREPGDGAAKVQTTRAQKELSWLRQLAIRFGRLAWSVVVFVVLGVGVALVFQAAQPQGRTPIQSFIVGATWPAIARAYLNGSRKSPNRGGPPDESAGTAQKLGPNPDSGGNVASAASMAAAEAPAQPRAEPAVSPEPSPIATNWLTRSPGPPD